GVLLECALFSPRDSHTDPLLEDIDAVFLLMFWFGIWIGSSLAFVDIGSARQVLIVFVRSALIVWHFVRWRWDGGVRSWGGVGYGNGRGVICWGGHWVGRGEAYGDGGGAWWKGWGEDTGGRGGEDGVGGVGGGRGRDRRVGWGGGGAGGGGGVGGLVGEVKGRWGGMSMVVCMGLGLVGGAGWGYGVGGCGEGSGRRGLLGRYGGGRGRRRAGGRSGCGLISCLGAASRVGVSVCGWSVSGRALARDSDWG
ncbi:hypothetical protein Tco_1140851, partial [Tanacetum coccineum]